MSGWVSRWRTAGTGSPAPRSPGGTRARRRRREALYSAGLSAAIWVQLANTTGPRRSRWRPAWDIRHGNQQPSGSGHETPRLVIPTTICSPPTEVHRAHDCNTFRVMTRDDAVDEFSTKKTNVRADRRHHPRVGAEGTTTPSSGSSVKRSQRTRKLPSPIR